jgi:hypothetical protein
MGYIWQKKLLTAPLNKLQINLKKGWNRDLNVNISQYKKPFRIRTASQLDIVQGNLKFLCRKMYLVRKQHNTHPLCCLQTGVLTNFIHIRPLITLTLNTIHAWTRSDGSHHTNHEWKQKLRWEHKARDACKMHTNCTYLLGRYPSTTENWKSESLACMLTTHADSAAASTGLPSIRHPSFTCTISPALSGRTYLRSYSLTPTRWLPSLSWRTARYGLPRGLAAQFIHGSLGLLHSQQNFI